MQVTPLHLIPHAFYRGSQWEKSYVYGASSESLCLLSRIYLVASPYVVENPVLLSLGGSIQPLPGITSLKTAWVGESRTPLGIGEGHL